MMTRSIMDAMPDEQARVRELLAAYLMLGAPGVFAVAVIEAALREAELAMGSGDAIRIIRAYERLKGITE